MRPLLIVLASTTMAALCFTAYLAGVNRTIARSAYVHSVFVQQDAECFTRAEKQLDCLHVSWQLRAGAVAESSSRALNSWLPSSMQTELEAYLLWARERSSIVYPSR